jgi:hypothetical protein
MSDIVSFLTTMAMLSVPLYMFLYFAKRSRLGALSLPCFTAITTIIYFYIMPFFVGMDDAANYLGIYLSNTHWMQLAITSYIIGAGLAFLFWEKSLNLDFYTVRENERIYNKIPYFILSSIIIFGLFYLILTNKLNLFSSSGFVFNKEEINDLAFVNVIFNIAIALCLVFSIKRNFDIFSWLLILLLTWVLIQTGFRYRVLILAASSATAFFILRGIKLRVSYTVFGAIGAVFLVNLLGSIRRYGEGVDLSRLENADFGSFFTQFSGEAGITFVTDYTANNTLPDPVFVEPWVVAIARLVPSFLWSNKPTATYLNNIISGATFKNAELAGAAAPQQVEMMFQMGWIGLPVLAFFYFSVAILLLTRINRLGREARIAGFALVPVFFGYYMQTRGYFSQILSDGLFFFLPLFILHWSDRRTGPTRARTLIQQVPTAHSQGQN